MKLMPGEVRKGITMAAYAEMLLDKIGLKEKRISIEQGRGAEFDEYVLKVDGYIEVYEGEMERASIVETKMVPCYDIGRVRHYSNYPFEPDEWDWDCDEQVEGAARAVEAALQMVLSDLVGYVAQGVSESWYAEEWKEHDEAEQRYWQEVAEERKVAK